VSDDIKGRVQVAMQELDYRPNELARSLRRGQTNTIGLVLPDSSNPFFAEVGQAIETFAYESGFSVILGNTYGELDKEDHYITVLQNKQVDGIIFLAAGDRTSSIRKLLEQHFPVVLVDRDLENIQIDAVMLNNQNGGYLVTKHLINLGHKRIGIITGPSNLTPSAQRITGYCEALQEAGVDCEGSLIVKGDFHPNSGYKAAIELLNLKNTPTAIFAFNDLMAMGVIRAASEKDLRVPDDLAIVGFDDIELASYTIPPLTTLAQPIKDFGRIAVELLTEQIEQTNTGPRRIMLSGKLVVRGTCGAG
jgi:LacI family transcriptional regulator